MCNLRDSITRRTEIVSEGVFVRKCMCYVIRSVPTLVHL